MALGVGEPCAGRYAPSRQASANARASRRSVFTLRVRVAYMGAKFGSATITLWPSPSRHRATHSLSVADPRRFRAGGRAPSASAKCRGSVRIRRSISSPPLGQDANLAFLLVDANMVHGWPLPLRL